MHNLTDRKTGARGLSVLACAGLVSILSLGSASAQQAGPARSNQYYSRYQPNPDAARSREERGGGGPGFNAFSYDPLIPLKQEVPPPVDPNEPASGSYGAMLQGRNPAAGT